MLEHKQLKIDLFSPEKIALLKEVNKNPELCENCMEYRDADDWGLMLGEIAAYCNVVMDGEYYPAELDKIYVDLMFRLKWKNKFL